MKKFTGILLFSFALLLLVAFSEKFVIKHESEEEADAPQWFAQWYEMETCERQFGKPECNGFDSKSIQFKNNLLFHRRAVSNCRCKQQYRWATGRWRFQIN